MSNRKYDNYSTFDGYNNVTTVKSGVYKTYEKYSEKDDTVRKLPQQHPNYVEGSNQPQQPPPNQPAQGFSNQGPLPSQRVQAPPRGDPQDQRLAPMNQEHQAPPQQQMRVKDIDATYLFNMLTQPQFKVARSGKPAKIIVKVSTTWCEPCKQVAPKFEEIARDPKYNDILFVTVDGDKLIPELSQLLQVSAVPVFIGYISQKQSGRVNGPNIAEIMNLCDTIASN